MRISDWSSDVFSSDLVGQIQVEQDDVVIIELAQIEAFLAQIGRIDVEALGGEHRVDRLRGRRLVLDQQYAHWAPLDCFPRWSRAPPASPSWDVIVRSLCRRSEEHTSELQSRMRIAYAVFCLKKKTRDGIPTWTYETKLPH